MPNIAKPRAANGAAKKRPAAKRPSADTAEKKARLRTPQKADTWYHAVPGSEDPPWAHHFADVLDAPLHKLKQKLGSKAKLVIWSDCAGKCTEINASRAIADELVKRIGTDIDFSLHGGSDSSHLCREFVQKNCSPRHFAADIYNRDFTAGTFECLMCQGTCALPRAGVDIYVCCFPCGPWSKRGKRLGLADKDGGVCWQAIKSIQHMKPAMFIMENVVSIVHAISDGSGDLKLIKDFMADTLGNEYNSMTITGVTPLHHGYPADRKRVIVVGARKDVAAQADVENTFGELIRTPLMVTHTYWTFLGLTSVDDATLATVGQLPSPSASVLIQRSPCLCCIDPMVVCPVHPCLCDRCKTGADGQCIWRVLMKKFLTANELWPSAVDGNALTYIQALELMSHPVPQSARERNVLNVFARLPPAQPLNSTMLIFDLSQAVDRCMPTVDGTVPTMATNAKMWSMRAGRPLYVSEMAKLMGHDLSTADLERTSSRRMAHTLGMSIHVATVGFALIGLLAAFGSS